MSPPPVTSENRDELRAFMLDVINPRETIEQAAKQLEKKTDRIQKQRIARGEPAVTPTEEIMDILCGLILLHYRTTPPTDPPPPEAQ